MDVKLKSVDLGFHPLAFFTCHCYNSCHPVTATPFKNTNVTTNEGIHLSSSKYTNSQIWSLIWCQNNAPCLTQTVSAVIFIMSEWYKAQIQLFPYVIYLDCSFTDVPLLEKSLSRFSFFSFTTLVYFIEVLFHNCQWLRLYNSSHHGISLNMVQYKPFNWCFLTEHSSNLSVGDFSLTETFKRSHAGFCHSLFLCWTLSRSWNSGSVIWEIRALAPGFRASPFGFASLDWINVQTKLVSGRKGVAFVFQCGGIGLYVFRER